MEVDGMTLQVLTPDQTLLKEDNLSHIRVKLADGGSIGIRPKHHPLLAETEAGEVEYGIEKYDQSIPLQAGILEIDFSRITIYTRGVMGANDEEKPEGGKLDFKRLTQTLLDGFRFQNHPE